MKHRESTNGDGHTGRVLIISLRQAYPQVHRCLRHEFEDVVASVDSGRILAPLASPRRRGLVRRVFRRLDASAGRLWRGFGPRPRAPFDLAFIGCTTLADLVGLNPASWRGVAKATACCVDDLYANRDRRRTGELALLREFDLVFTGCEGSVEEFSAILGKPCRYLPFSVDTLMFCPYPHPPRRMIDVYAMGRRPAETHSAFRQLARRRDWFYLYDTSYEPQVSSYLEHRQRLADLIGRSRYFLVNPGKMTTAEINGQEEIGYRYFEGAAAGAVMIGERPRTPAFGRLFDWSDSVVHLPFNSPQVEGAIEALEQDRDRVERIRRTNVAQSLRRHDHVHRWGEVLAVAGLPPTRAMEARIRLLERRAREVEAGLPADARAQRPERVAALVGERFGRGEPRSARRAAAERGALWRYAPPPAAPRDVPRS
jgi:hypothetical protein